MSRISEMIEAEAEAAEAEDETDDGELESEPEALEPDAPEPPAVDPEKAFKQIERENERHAKAVQRIMGADFEVVYPCPTCADFAAGFTLTAPDVTPPLEHCAEFQRCGKCAGHGAVLTGALTEIGYTTTCRGCGGQGFIEVVLEPAPLPPMPNAPSPHASLANELRAQGYMVIDPPRSQAPQPA